MKTLIASLAAVAAIAATASTASAGYGHRHSGYGYGYGHFHAKRVYVAPTYYAPVKCHIVYKHGYATKVCHQVW